ncbi:MAG: flagellar hook-associated protein FlgK [Planctomycetota bacterium]|jgi:flagellar hook-associated protein 1 FlgK|nr:MAG: flagellar hook-associated protein FlgK [Planctomycetota bacterium]RLS97079.1 MAG: flagellar hook-associated protein FlgK [Planctomycetota bacterium]
MSINGALQIGQSAILASQAAIQVAGNNMANAATPGYNRQVARLSPSRPEYIGRAGFIGTGVQLSRIVRTVDTALQNRTRSAVSEENAAGIDQRFLNAIESIRNELTDQDLSSRLSAFFNSFSELSNNPNDEAVRTVVIQQGSGLTTAMRELRNEHVNVRTEIDRALGATIRTADGLLDQIASVNRQVVESEQGGSGQANALRDRRDELVNEVAKYIPISTVEQPNGALDVFVGSIPVVLAGESRGITLRTDSSGDSTTLSLRVKADGSTLNPDGGQVGALFRQRGDNVDPAIEDLDTLARELAFQVNRIHSQAQGTKGWQSVTGLNGVLDTTTNLAADATGIPFDIRNGSFELHVTNQATGLRTTVVIAVDPNTTSMDQLAAQISAAMPGGTGNASVTADRTLKLTANSGYELTFSNDSSGVLAALGVNSFFGGSDASDLVINDAIAGDPRLLASGQGHVLGSNAAALDIARLEDTTVDSLGGRSLRGFWQSATTSLAVRTESANTKADSSRLVRESLDAQVQATSGVSLDEESINMLSYQRQFQAAARFIATVDETLQTLLSIV